jgi:hypothetical protein
MSHRRPFLLAALAPAPHETHIRWATKLGVNGPNQPLAALTLDRTKQGLAAVSGGLDNECHVLFVTASKQW